MRSARAIVAALCLLVAACRTSGITPPAAWEAGSYACSFCRMTVVERRFASQVVAPYDEPRFFDDMGCLSNYLKKQTALAAAAVVYVADHRTGAWIPAHAAVYTRVDALSAPMGSHIVAHETIASRESDPQASGGGALVVGDVFPSGLPGARR